MTKSLQQSVEAAIAKTIKYCNFAYDYYRSSKSPRAIFERLFTALAAEGLVGEFDLGDRNRAPAITKPDGFSALFRQRMKDNPDPQSRIQAAISRAFDSFCAEHFSLLDEGDAQDAWFMVDERQAYREIMEVWKGQGLLSDYFVIGPNRGVTYPWVWTDPAAYAPLEQKTGGPRPGLK